MTDAPPSWPAPDPTLGEALNIRQVADRLGDKTVAGVDVRLLRTRNGSAHVPFPEPAGTAAPAGQTRPMRYWWEAQIGEYQAASRRVGGNRRQLTADDIARIRRLYADGNGINNTSRLTGWSIATISRIINGKTHTPKGPQSK